MLISRAYSQQLNDVAVSKGITSVQYGYDHLANGMSFFDFDQDGWDDITMPLNGDSVIFYRNINGTFQSQTPFIDPIGTIREIIWVDYDSDHDFDLCVTYAEVGIRFYQNDGSLNFIDVTASSGISMSLMNSYGVSFADMNSDGHLDFYLCNYSGAAGTFTHENMLYINQGNGTFADSASVAGVGNGSQPSFMSMWYDFDEDEDLDLHVINDKNGFDDALYRNNGDFTFTDVAVNFGVDNIASDPMGMAISDFDNDGYQDIYISDVGASNPFFTFAEDGKLFQNLGGTVFANVTPAAGLDTSVMGWGVLWIDYNNDGYEDLYVASSKLDSLQINEEPSVFFINNTQGSFSLINDSLNGDIISSSYAPVKGDMNNDGFYDIIVLNDGVTSNVFENSGNTNHYIKITPEGTVSNYQAIGSKVRVYTQGIEQYQLVTCGSGICSQNSQHLIFGTGSSTTVDSVVITFPSGITVRKYNLPTGDSYVIEEQVQVLVDVIPGTTNITLCQGDSIQLDASSYQNIQWNTGNTDSVITVSTTGTFSFEAESLIGDTLYISTPLTVSIEQSPIYQTVVTDPECGPNTFGSATLLFISPPASEFNVLWSNGQTGIFLDSVAGGSYQYTMTSTNGCIYVDSVTITETPLFDVQFMTTPVTDDSLGAVQFFIFGGVAPYSFQLDSNAVSSTITDLTAGSYDVMITDANGCEVLVSFTIADLTTAGINEHFNSTINVLAFDQRVYIEGIDRGQTESIIILSPAGQRIGQEEDGEWNSSDLWTTVHEIPSGIYFIEVVTKTERQVIRLYID